MARTSISAAGGEATERSPIFGLWIRGAWRPALSQATFERVNPYNGISTHEVEWEGGEDDSLANHLSQIREIVQCRDAAMKEHAEVPARVVALVD